MPAPKDPIKRQKWIENISESRKGKDMGHKAWNKGLTKEIDERVRKQSEKMVGKHPTTETIEKRKATMRDPERRRRLSEIGKEVWKRLGYREKQTKSHLGKEPWNKDKTGVYSKETLEKMGKDIEDLTDEGLLHNKAYEMFEKANLNFCDVCGMSNEEHLQQTDKRLSMHNTLVPKDYNVQKLFAWRCMCNVHHLKLEQHLRNNKEYKE